MILNVIQETLISNEAEMAESIVTLFLEKIAELVEQEASLLLGVGQQVRLLQGELEWIRSFLKDADEKRKDNERVKVWVGQIREIAYDAEDIIDTFILRIEHRRQQQSWQRYVPSIKIVILRHRLRQKIEAINMRVERISANKSKYGIEGLQTGESSSSGHEGFSLWKAKRAPLVEEVDVVGFEDDAMALTRQLTDGNGRRSVVSIVGMGGLGKTTLAKKIYNSTHVKRHFNFHSWVYVSQKYRIKELLFEITKSFMSLTKEQIDNLSVEDIRSELFAHLRNKKYLIVIDDIWSTEAWDGIEAALPEGMNGSRVMLTTRKKNVALHADECSIPHELRFLKDEECWELLCKKAFTRNVSRSCPPDLEEFGRAIASRCGGLPLAVVVLGGLLSRKEKSPHEWGKVLKSITWQLREGESQITRILALSYDDLPYYLKSCFLYLGVFLEDSEIRTITLFQLWIAEGFIHERGEEAMEEVAEDYLQELIQRSLLQATERNAHGGIRKCRIHDLLRDLAISEAKEDKFLEVIDHTTDTHSSWRARRLAIHNPTAGFTVSCHAMPSLRSLLCFTPGRTWVEYLPRNFKLLRVADISGSLVTHLPDEIGKLIHLRYLGMKGNSLKEIPSSIGNLFNLQTLDLRGQGIITLPKSIEKMHQLRHMQMGFLTRFAGIPRLEGLRNLRTLSKLRFGSWARYALGRLTNLTKLGLFGNLSQHGQLDFIANLDNLQSLRLRESPGCRIRLRVPLSDHTHLYNLHLDGGLARLPSSSELPPNLTKLSLKNCRLDQDPFPTLEKLRSLRILRLLFDSFVGKEMVCSSGGFLQLRSLELKGLGELEELVVEEGAIVSLRHLEISNCDKLKMIPEGLRHVSSLQELQLDMPRRFVLRLREVDGDDWGKIQHIPFVITK
ncbi:hypothetical protein ACLOJK_009205 [Asimina triloba]